MPPTMLSTRRWRRAGWWRRAARSPLEIKVNNLRVMRYDFENGSSPNLLGGHPNNSVGAFGLGQTVAGGGAFGNTCVDPDTGQFTRSCSNRVSNGYATVSGGYNNLA